MHCSQQERMDRTTATDPNNNIVAELVQISFSKASLSHERPWSIGDSFCDSCLLTILLIILNRRRAQTVYWVTKFTLQ